MRALNTQKKECITDESKIGSWTNADNSNIYKSIPIEIFTAIATQGGLNTGCDVDAISSYIKSADSILEVGAGYGRVIDFILQLGYQGKLTAIERAVTLCKYLRNKFNDKLTIICGDIQNYQLNESYNLILWMWAGLFEFSKIEQPLVIKKLASYLKNKGFLIIDVVPIECKTQNTCDYDLHNRVVSTQYGEDYCYLPDCSEFEEYIRNSSLQICEKISYLTTTHKTNYLYVLQKNN